MRPDRMTDHRWRRGALAIAALLALAGCAGLNQPDPGGDVRTAALALSALPLGPNLVKETCRAQPAPAAADAAGALNAYDVFCGEWEQPSGRVYQTLAAASGPELLRRYATDSWWAQALGARMDCQPAESTRILDGVEALLLNCRLRDGGWPYIALVASLDGSVYLADGIPAILPPLEQAVGGLSGRVDLDSGERPATQSAALQRLEALLGGRFYGTGDLETYRRLMAAGQHYNGLKQFAEAEARYREALLVHRRVLPDDETGRADVLMHLGLELSNQQRYAEAEALFDRADALLRTGSVDPTDRPRLVSYRALDLANQQRYDGALDLAEEATAMRRTVAAQPSGGQEIGPVSTAGRVDLGLAAAETRGVSSGLGSFMVGDIVQSLYIEAAMLQHLGNGADAEARIAEALAALDRLSNPPGWWRPQIYILKAEILASRGDYAAAERILLDSIAAQRKVFDESRVEARARLALGRLYRRMDRPADALAAFEAAFDLVQAEDGSLEFREVVPYFETAMAEIARHPDRRAELSAAMFRAAQLVRGTVTSKTVARVAARLSSSDPKVAAVTRDLQDAQIERTRTAQALDQAEGRPDVAAAELQALRQRLAEAEDRVRRLEPQVQAALSTYNLLLDSPVEAGAISAVLAPNEALVQILLGEPESFVFLVRRDGVEVRAIDLTRSAAAGIVKHLRAPFDTAEYLPDFDVAEAYRLYRLIFEPIEDRLAGIDHLITVPTGPLLSLPLGLLVMEPPPPIRNYDYTQVKWLAARFALTVATSAGNFADMRAKARPSAAPNPFIGFGDFVPVGDVALIVENADRAAARQTAQGAAEGTAEGTAEGPARNRPLSDACRADLRRVAQAAPLPETAQEVRAIARAVGAGTDGVVLGSAFTEIAMRERPLDRYRIVYLATHALLPGELDCWPEPAMLVSRPAGAPAGADGLLEASEISELKLDADLVVLSGCNTGAGDGGGESLTGLARAFIHAGSRSLIASHWVAESRQTVELMVGTFTRLADGRATTLAGALRLSKLALMKDAYSSHPYYWALFTVIGDGGRRLLPQAEG